MIKKYKTLYPFTIWVTTFSDWNKVLNKFLFYPNLEDLYNDVSYTKADVAEPMFSTAVVYLVREKSNKDSYGAIVLLNEDYIEDFSYMIDTIAHESVHIADYIWMHIDGGNTKDGINEPYAYLVGWIAGRISDYLIEYKAADENGKEV